VTTDVSQNSSIPVAYDILDYNISYSFKQLNTIYCVDLLLYLVIKPT